MIPRKDDCEQTVPAEKRLSRWFVAAVIANDMLTVLTFIWWGIAGQLPMNFALAGAGLLGIPLVMIWSSPSPLPVGIGCLAGMLLGLLIGDVLLGIPLNGPIPARPNLMFDRMLGPLVGCAFAGTATLFITVLTHGIQPPEVEVNAH